MRPLTLPAFLSLAASIASAQKHYQGDHHVGHAHRSRDWDWNGGYPHGGAGCVQHMPGGMPPAATSYSNSTFKQLIDHNDPSLGTFDQFYYYDTTYWKGKAVFGGYSGRD